VPAFSLAFTIASHIVRVTRLRNRLSVADKCFFWGDSEELMLLCCPFLGMASILVPT
jgi:hypothetical protein